MGYQRQIEREKVRHFKFLRTGLKSNHNGFQWETGKWHKTECLELCHGFNCSEKILDALKYVKGEILCEVEARGTSYAGNDKSTWQQMRIIKVWNWTKKDSVALSIFSAESVIENYEKMYPKDDRPRKAIEAAKDWLKESSKKNADAAHACAAAAAHAASYAADNAAAYAHAAAYAAAAYANAAAYAAAAAADNAAHAAACAYAAAHAASYADAAHACAAAAAALLDKINAWLVAHLDEMEEWKP